MATAQSSATAAEVEEVDLPFLKFLGAVKQELPAELVEQMSVGLNKRHAKPPLDELSACLKRQVPLAKARSMLFYPDEEEMRLYAQLLAMPPPGSTEEHSQFKVQVTAMAPLYLVHCREWRLMQPFIESGGLSALHAMLHASNLYLASQAMSVLLSITDEDLFPWHEPPSTPGGRGPRHGPYALAWKKMYELGSKGSFLASLLHHGPPGTFPGSSLLALRLLAFFLSWLRLHFTTPVPVPNPANADLEEGSSSSAMDASASASPSGSRQLEKTPREPTFKRELRVSAKLLDALRAWACDERVSADELALAKQLVEDFGSAPAAQGASSSSTDPSSSSHGYSNLQAFEDPDDADDGCQPACTTTASRTLINSSTDAEAGGEAEALKAQGNEAYKRGEYGAAIELYSRALDVGVPAARLLSEGPRRAVYHANRAAAYLARADALGGKAGMPDMCGLLEGVDLSDSSMQPMVTSKHYEAALLDADSALGLDPSNVKAHLRKAQALAKLGKMAECKEAVRAGLHACGGEGAQLQATDPRVTVLQQLKQLLAPGLQTGGLEQEQREDAAVHTSPHAGAESEGVSVVSVVEGYADVAAMHEVGTSGHKKDGPFGPSVLTSSSGVEAASTTAVSPAGSKGSDWGDMD